MRWSIGSPPYQWQGEINQESEQLRGLLLWFPLRDQGTNERLINLPTTRGGAVAPAVNAVTGQSWSFTGASGDYIDIGDTSLVDFGASDWGISVWAMTTTTSGADHLFSKDGTGGTNPRQFTMLRNGASLGMYYWTAPGVYVYYDPGTSWLTANQWHHIVMQRHGNTFEFAVDGIIKATNAGTGSHGTMNAGTIAARIGARVFSGFTDPWTGQLADFRVRTRALSAAEIWQLYDPQTRWELYAMPRPMVWWIPPAGTTYTQSLDAEIEPLTYAGTVVWPTKELLRTLAASLTPTGALTYLKALLRTLTAGVTPAANLVRGIAHTLTAEIEPLTYAGTVVWPTKQLLRILTAEIEPLTYAGTVVWPTKELLRTLAASLTPTGALAAIRAFSRTLTASLTPAANLVRGIAHTLTAEMEPLTYAGTVVWPTKQLLRTLAASLTPSGALIPLKAFFRMLAAELTPAASLVRGVARTLTAEIEPLTYAGLTVWPTKQLLRTLAASLTPTGALSAIRAYVRTLTASVTPTGALSAIRAYLLTLAASVTPSASLVRGVARTLTASLMPFASLLRLLSGVTGGRAKCTLTVQAATTARLAMANATTCGLELSEV